MAAPMLLRGIPVLRHRFAQRTSAVRFISWMGVPSFFISTDRSSSQDNNVTNAAANGTESTASAKFSRWEDSPDYRQWRDREAKILQDIEPTIAIAKEILHSNRYLDGERLSAEDEKAVVEKLLAYHPHSEDKIGSGLDSIMVDRHPEFKQTRCLFVVRTDGGWIDFSYQKCLRAYVRVKYPCYAERFIQSHFKRGSIVRSGIS